MKLVKHPKKRQDLPGPEGIASGLWVVATPIGNLGDISARAREALGFAARILCEDTRRTVQLLHALAIAPRGGERFELERMDAYASSARLEQVIQWLEEGENLALVTDAGTPAISDPGAALVRLALERGIRVTPIPGPSALTALLSVSGFGESSFSFRGFFPRKPSERAQEVKVLLEISARADLRVHCWFESPQRIVEALQALHEGLSEAAPGTRVCVAKELTKLHEKIFSGSCAEVLEQVSAHVAKEGEKGEWCFAVLLPSHEGIETVSEQSSEWVKALQCMLETAGGNPPIRASDAAQRVSQYFGVPKKLAYEKALRISGKKS